LRQIASHQKILIVTPHMSHANALQRDSQCVQRKRLPYSTT
jgi:hypothetical protein